MIKYAMRCGDGHGFEGWFSSMADYDEQAELGQLSCPACGSGDVGKALMAPAVRTSRQAETAAAARLAEIQAVVEDSARRARAYVEKNFEGVGKRFPEEARKIHYGEAEDRPIYGEATPKEAKDLAEEGVAITPVPGLASDGKAKLN